MTLSSSTRSGTREWLRPVVHSTSNFQTIRTHCGGSFYAPYMHAVSHHVLDEQDATEHVRFPTRCVLGLVAMWRQTLNEAHPVNIATALTLMPLMSRTTEERRWLAAISLLTATTAIFRAELAMYLGPVALQAIVSRRCGFKGLFITGAVSGLASAGEGWRSVMRNVANPRFAKVLARQ